jgi:hypothetical protein
LDQASVRPYERSTKRKAMMQSALADAPNRHAVPWRTHEQVIYKKYDIKFIA